ncbi:hypothetical protein [Radiobacillus sp. PE A8.2]|uniref:hypothetical protein n=1 Tax=Radiobacillus sp. PE A8.2 TaxID=3380349 RepID=UPI003890F821
MDALKQVTKVVQALETYDIAYALGGSGLLYSLGLTNDVGDWDITTNETKTKVIQSIATSDYEALACGEYPYGTKYKIPKLQ